MSLNQSINHLRHNTFLMFGLKLHFLNENFSDHATLIRPHDLLIDTSRYFAEILSFLIDQKLVKNIKSCDTLSPHLPLAKLRFIPAIN